MYTANYFFVFLFIFFKKIFSEQFYNSQVFQEMQVCDLFTVGDTQLCFCMGQGTTFVTPVLFYTKARLQ